jgi:bifunctional DNA-binding transcriptional regulator/antitoxin component of YhaV-PrlF toxin-antitoxin module
MSATTVNGNGQTTLPKAIFEAAGLKANDQIEWRVENGEIHGRKLGAEAATDEVFPAGSLLPYLTDERDEEQIAILSGCVKGPVERE